MVTSFFSKISKPGTALSSPDEDAILPQEEGGMKKISRAPFSTCLDCNNSQQFHLQPFSQMAKDGFLATKLERS